MAQPHPTALATAPRPPRSHDPYAALRFRDYRLFLAGTVLATIGGQMQTVAVGWDRFERGRVVMASLVLTTIASLGLALVSYAHASVGLVYACLVLSRVSRAFQ